MRIMAVGAHPDDIEILSAGTLARYVADGHDVTMCHASLGDRGSYTQSREEIATIRLEEARRSAEMINADHLTLGLSDGEINAADPTQRLAVVELVRVARPDVVITHCSNDYMNDHNETSKLIAYASFFATLPLMETRSQPLVKVPVLYFMDSLMGSGFQPTEYVDISSTIDTKLAMLGQHESQIKWLREHDNVDIVDNIRTVARFRGLQCGVEYAEAFSQSLVWTRATTTRYLP